MASDSTGRQDLRTYLRILWRWKFLFLIFLVPVPLAAYLLERGQPKVYQSRALLSLAGNPTAAVPVATDQQQVEAAARLLTTTPVAKKAAMLLPRPPANSASLLEGVTASGDPTTGFVTITAQNRDPVRAAAIANAFARALGGDQTLQSRRAIKSQIQALLKQQQAISPTDQASRSALTVEITQLRAQLASAATGAQIVQPAMVSTTPVGPNTRRAVELGLLIALLLAIGAVVLAENGDRRLRSPEDLEDLTKLPLLGTVPSSAFKPEHDAAPRDVEAFQMLRASLTYFNVERPLSSVAIISPLAADGKTTVAVGLAVAAARAGKRVILVDADLRRPQVCTRLGITPTAGLGAVVAGEADLPDVLVELDVGAPEGGSLMVVPAGPPPPNPAALLSSEAMRDGLRELESHADLVLVDTAAVLAVSDALPLLQAASGVAIVVRMNRSSRAAVRRLQKVIGSTQGNMIGVVATGISSVSAGYEDSSYYYAQDGPRPRGLRRWQRRRLRRRRERRPHSAQSGAAIPLKQATVTESNGAYISEFQPAVSQVDDPRDED